MAGVNLSVEARGIERVQEILKQLEAAGKNMTPMFDEIGAYLSSETALQFRNAEDPNDKAWKVSQRARDEGGKTLTDFGHLRDSFTYFANRQSVIFGSNLVYSAIHHFGGQAGKGLKTKLPARPILGLNAQRNDDILEIVEDFYRDAIR